jgi:hypothetical protein
VSTIKKNRKMVRVKAGKPLLGGHRKSSFPIRRNKKTINPGPNGRITRDRQV